MPSKGKKKQSKAPAAKAPSPAAPKAPPIAPTLTSGQKQEQYVREAAGRNSDSELGSEIDQLPDDSESEDQLPDEWEDPDSDCGDCAESIVRDAKALFEAGPQKNEEEYNDWCYFFCGLFDILNSLYVHDFKQRLPEKVRARGRRDTRSAATQTAPPTRNYMESAVQTSPPRKIKSVATQTTPTKKIAYTEAAAQTPPRKKIEYTEAAAQTPPPKKTAYAEAVAQTPLPQQRKYTETAVQTPPPRKGAQQQSGKGKAPLAETARNTPAENTPPTRDPPTRARPAKPAQRARPPPSSVDGDPQPTRALVMHAAPLKYKPGTMRRWIEEDNRGVKILGIRWLLKEHRRGYDASSLVIYLRDPVECTKLRMGRRLFRTTGYDWDRGSRRMSA